MGNRAIETIEKIQSAFIELAQKKEGRDLTVKEISSKAGIHRSTFYQYYFDTTDLQNQLMESFLEGMHFYRSDPSHYPWDLTPVPSIEEWFKYCLERRGLLKVLWKANGDEEFDRLFREKLCGDINRMMDDENMPKDALRPFCVELFYSLHVSLLRFAIQTADTEIALPPERLAALANNWRASAILSEQKNGIATSVQDFKLMMQEKIYP